MFSSPPLQLGPLSIPFPVIQAALSGYSDAPMRKIARKFGAGFTLCEVLLDQFVIAVSKGNKAKLYIRVEQEEHPCGAQLMGSEPEMFVAAAQKLVERGFDLIDLNFACPVKKVLGRLRGGYLMSDPAKALEIVARVRESLPERIPLTIKLRKGFDDSPESERKFYEILDGAVGLGIAGATVHGRTVRQRYEGKSDWEFIRNVKSHLRAIGRSDVAVIGSGDLFSPTDCLARLRESGIDGLALARGVIGNPWLFRDVRAALEGKPIPPPPSLSEQRAVIEEHYQLVEELYGAKRGGTTMRGFGVRYAQLHPEVDQVRAAFVRTKTRDQWLAVLDQWYGER